MPRLAWPTASRAKNLCLSIWYGGANPCPPIVLGIGIGGSFDHCAALAIKALLRPLDEPNADPYYAALEKELLDAINSTGFGPQGFGGATTCLGVAIEQKPTHVACLPVAVNISCHVTRRASRTLQGGATMQYGNLKTPLSAQIQPLKAGGHCCCRAWSTPPVTPPTPA